MTILVAQSGILRAESSRVAQERAARHGASGDWFGAALALLVLAMVAAAFVSEVRRLRRKRKRRTPGT